jgi:ABC-2 type transport system permease protein
MKAISKWTIWQRRVSTVWWSIGVCGFLLVNMVFYPSFKDQAEQLQKSFENIPEAALQLFGGSSDFFSPVGFLNSQIFFLMLPLLLGILAISLGSSLLAREEQDRTIESLLARPVSRSGLLLGKSGAGTIILTIVTLVGLLTTLITAKIVDIAVPTMNIALATFACFVLALSFGAIAFMLTTIGKARGASIGIATLIALGGYLINSLSGTVSWLKIPSKLFPFHYYDPESILRGSFAWGNILFLLFVIVVCGAVSWFSFKRRDLA